MQHSIPQNRRPTKRICNKTYSEQPTYKEDKQHNILKTAGQRATGIICNTTSPKRQTKRRMHMHSKSLQCLDSINHDYLYFRFVSCQACNCTDQKHALSYKCSNMQAYTISSYILIVPLVYFSASVSFTISPLTKIYREAFEMVQMTRLTNKQTYLEPAWVFLGQFDNLI